MRGKAGELFALARAVDGLFAVEKCLLVPIIRHTSQSFIASITYFQRTARVSITGSQTRLGSVSARPLVRQDHGAVLLALRVRSLLLGNGILKMIVRNDSCLGRTATLPAAHQNLAKIY
jgi:hypothetical protein